MTAPTIHHHPSDDLLMNYAAGALPEAFDLVIATHASLCDECRARIGGFEAVGGAVLEQVAEARLSEGALARTLARIAPENRVQPSAATPKIPDPKVFPAPLRFYAGGDLDAVRWRNIGGGVAQSVLKVAGSDEASLRLLRIAPDTAVPDHGHSGIELTMVLQGAFRDSGGRYGRGDVEIADADTVHTPVAEPGLPCICLAATAGRLRFRSLLPRLAQPFLGI